MAFLKTGDTAEHDRPVETEVEGEIREFVRRDIATSFRRQPESESETVASNINAVLQRATGTSVQEIEKLITELQTLRDTLQSEAARAQREIVEYATLTQGALQSTKIIAESLTNLKKVADVRRPEVEHRTSPTLYGGATDQGSQIDLEGPTAAVPISWPPA
jgi:cation transport regulator ChaC